MNANQKPIIQYVESINDCWPSPIQETLDFLFEKIAAVDNAYLIAEEVKYLTDKIYQEGYKDGLELNNWLENRQLQSEKYALILHIPLIYIQGFIRHLHLYFSLYVNVS